MSSTAAKTVKRRHRQKAEIVVDAIVRAPLGDLCRISQALVARDRETALFFRTKLTEALSPPAESTTAPKQEA